MMEKTMATHSSSLAWKIPWMEEPGGLPSVGSHRGGHDWSDLAAAEQMNNDMQNMTYNPCPVNVHKVTSKWFLDINVNCKARKFLEEIEYSHIRQTLNKHYTQWWKSERISSKIRNNRNNTRTPTLAIFNQHSLGCPSHSNETETPNLKRSKFATESAFVISVCSQIRQS